MPQAAHEPTPHLGLVVSVGRQRDGFAFQLEPKSRAKVQAKSPDTRPVRQVFISFDTRDDFESAHGPMWKQVVVMLTGMREQDLRDLGAVHFIDPVAGTELAEVSF